ncbi:MAG: tRNA pseudouridine(38-40) synthase TruA [Candidatus Omnitrophota bacterium]
MRRRRRNVRLTIQYEGTAYAGWQFQTNATSIQEMVESALRSTLGEHVKVTASGRTDAGVHALAQAANFRTRSRLPLANIQKALNSRLPKDIVISRIEEAGPSFDSQHDARYKLYRYTIVNNDFTSPFLRRFASRCFHKLDTAVMRREAKLLVGRHDFRSFQAVDGQERKTIKTVRSIKIKRSGDVITVDIEADGFLYNMARTIVGTLIEVGRGKLEPGSVKEMLRKRDRRCCGPTAPAKGLCLIKVTY